MKRFEDRCNVLKFWSFGDSTGGCILDQLESVNVLGGGIEIQRVAVVKFGVNEGRSYSECAGMCQGVTYSSEVADVNEAVFRYGGDVVRERESGVKDETKVVCRGDRFENDVGGDEESRVVDFS